MVWQTGVNTHTHWTGGTGATLFNSEPRERQKGGVGKYGRAEGESMERNLYREPTRGRKQIECEKGRMMAHAKKKKRKERSASGGHQTERKRGGGVLHDYILRPQNACLLHRKWSDSRA